MPAAPAAIEFARLAGPVGCDHKVARLPGTEAMEIPGPETGDHRQVHGRGHMHRAGIDPDEDARGRCQGGEFGKRERAREFVNAMAATLRKRAHEGLLPGLVSADDHDRQPATLAVIEKVPAQGLWQGAAALSGARRKQYEALVRDLAHGEQRVGARVGRGPRLDGGAPRGGTHHQTQTPQEIEMQFGDMAAVRVGGRGQGMGKEPPPQESLEGGAVRDRRRPHGVGDAQKGDERRTP